MSNTFRIEPYSKVITLTSNQEFSLPSGSIHFEIKKILNTSTNLTDHTWYGEIKYTSPNSYFLLYATTIDISDDDTLSSNILFISIDSDSIKLTNKYATSLNLQITILS